MILHLREFETFPAHTCLEADPNAFELNYDGVNGAKQITVDLDIQKSNDEYYCRGHVRATLILECARCLSRFDRAFTGKMDFIVCFEALARERTDSSLDNEDYILCQSEGMKADISEMVRQTIILSVPLMPLCSQNCRGLCPSCGVNRNEHSCNCQDNRIDERWEGLKGLLRA